MSSPTSNRVPLGSVKTYREGFLRLQGWMTFSGLAFFTAGLAVMFEVRHDTAATALLLSGVALLIMHVPCSLTAVQHLWLLCYPSSTAVPANMEYTCGSSC